MNRDATPRVADRFLSAIFETAGMLQQFPQAGTICAPLSPRLGEVRRFPLTLPFGKWLIVYVVQPEGILILRVLHGSQDWKKLFP